MAKFCKNCGSPLDENGKCPKCDKETKQEVKEETSEEATNILNTFKNILIKPITTCKDYLENENLKGAFIIALISILIMALCTPLIYKNTLASIIKTVFNKLNTLAGMVGEEAATTQDLNQTLQSLNQTNYFTSFIIYFIFDFILVLLYGLFAKLFVGNAFKGNGTTKHYLIATLVPTSILAINSVLQLIASYIVWQLQYIIGIVFLVIYLVVTVEIFVKILSAKENKLMYSVTLSILLTLIVYIIIVAIYAVSVVAIKTNNINNQITSGNYGSNPWSSTGSSSSGSSSLFE